MFGKEEKISSGQFAALIVVALFGVNMAAFPRALTAETGGAAWFCELCVSAVSAVSAYVLLKIAQGFDWKNLPRPISIFFGGLFTIKTLLSAGITCAIFARWLRHAMLPSFKFWLAAALLAASAVYCAGRGIEARARLARILAVSALFPAVIIIELFTGSLIGLKSAVPLDFSELAAFEISKGGLFHALQPFGGIELIIMSSAFLRKRDSGGKAAFFALSFIGVSAAALSAAAVAKFGVNGVVSRDYPSLEVAGASSALSSSFFIISSFAYMSACLFAAGRVVTEVFAVKSKEKISKFLPWILGIIAVLTSLLPINELQTANLREFLNILGMLLFFVPIPIVFCIIKTLRKRGSKA